jgi:hypothetical protein
MEAISELRMADRVYSRPLQWLLRAGAALGLIIYLALLPALLWQPQWALRLLWFLFIPIAPMFLLAAPNAWVSLCPVSTVQTLARRFGWQGGRRLSQATSLRLQTAGWLLMFLGIPSRHLLFNTDGGAVFAAATVITLLAFGIGLAFYSLSGWCVGACPIRPVEVLYGLFSLDGKRPEKCTTCTGCIAPCVRIRPTKGGQELGRTPLITLLVFAFPGFVASYFLLDWFNLCTTEHWYFKTGTSAPTAWLAQTTLVYGVMALGSFVSLITFCCAGRWGVSQTRLLRCAALTAYSCYYIGVVPEIVEAWALDARWGWGMIMLPGLVLAAALYMPRVARS